MTRVLLLLVWACVAVCDAGCSSNAPPCYDTETQCWEAVNVSPEAADAGASLSIADASTDAAEEGAP